MATNRADTLDPALLRPGRLDRKIEFPVPDRRQKRMVLTACTAKMNLSEVCLHTSLGFVYVLVPGNSNPVSTAEVLALFGWSVAGNHATLCSS